MNATRYRTAPSLLIQDGQTIKAGQQLATWDPMTRPIITEYAGRVKFENVIENVTVMNQVDEVTGLSSLVVIDPKKRYEERTRASSRWHPAPVGSLDR